MAYVIDPHCVFANRLLRLLRQRSVPLRGCRLSQVWPAVGKAITAYELWPTARTVYWCAMTHRDTAQGPMTEISFSAYYAHVNLDNERTLTTASHLVLSTPFQIQWRGLEFLLRSCDYTDVAQWIFAVQEHPWLVATARQDPLWSRGIRQDSPARAP
jgi:hypothetical protein